MSQAPLREYLGWRGLPGVRRDHVVIPRRLAERMPTDWQQNAAAVLEQFHRAHAHTEWPIYRVAASQPIPVRECTDAQLAQVGITAEPGADGERVFHHVGSGQVIRDPDGQQVLVDRAEPELDAVGRVPWCWWVGAHGGAGTSSLSAVVEGTGDGGLHPPVGPHSPWAVMVARTHRHGLDHAAGAAARPPPGLVGLVTVADAPGKLPAGLQRRREQVEAAYARSWRLPWIPEWRESPPQPGQAPPEPVRAVAVEVAEIVSRLAS